MADQILKDNKGFTSLILGINKVYLIIYLWISDSVSCGARPNYTVR
jgi:hypothetical protein